MYHKIREELSAHENIMFRKKEILDYFFLTKAPLNTKQLDFLNEKIFFSPVLVSLILKTTKFRTSATEASNFILHKDEIDSLASLINSEEFQGREFHYNIVLYSDSHFTPLQIYSSATGLKIFSVDGMPSFLKEIARLSRNINAQVIQYDSNGVAHYLQQATYGCDVFAIQYLLEMEKLSEEQKNSCTSFKGLAPGFLKFTQSLSQLEELQKSRKDLYNEALNKDDGSLGKCLKANTVLGIDRKSTIYSQNRNIDYKTYELLINIRNKLEDLLNNIGEVGITDMITNRLDGLLPRLDISSYKDRHMSVELTCHLDKITLYFTSKGKNIDLIKDCKTTDEVLAVMVDSNEAIHIYIITHDTGGLLEQIDHNIENINNQNAEGNTALHLAIILKKYYMAELLIDAGATTELRNKDGKTILDLVEEHNLLPLYQKISPNCYNSFTARKFDLLYDAESAQNNLDLPIHTISEGEEASLSALEDTYQEAEPTAFSPKSSYLSGLFIGSFIINPSIRYLKDKLNGENEHKLWSKYYSEMLSLDILNNFATSMALSSATKVISLSLGVPQHLIIGDSYIPYLLARVTDSPLAQGLLQSTLIEATMLASDGIKLAGKTAYDFCTSVETE